MASGGKIIADTTVLEVIRHTSSHIELVLQCHHQADVHPGQFVQVLVPDAQHVFLRRPFSIHDWDEGKQIMSLYIKVVGEGSRRLSQLWPGTILNIIYPLGNGFRIKSDIRALFLVGGGCGAAPLFFLAKTLQKKGIPFRVLLGAKTARELVKVHEFRKLALTDVATEDGSEGFHGFVTDHPLVQSAQEAFDQVIACGPEMMMKQVWKIFQAKKVPVQVSLEHLMACGFGVCLCCVVATQQGNVCTCTDGPVFDAEKLKNW